MLVRIAVSAALVAVAVAASGCAQVSDLLTPGPKVVTIEATVAAPAAPVNGELPEGAPEGLPLWPEATVVEGSSSQTAYDVILSTGAPLDDVVLGMAKGFEDAGWDVAQESLGEGAERLVVLTVSRPTHEGIVTISPGEADDVAISYVISAVE